MMFRRVSMRVMYCTKMSLLAMMMKIVFTIPRYLRVYPYVNIYTNPFLVTNVQIVSGEKAYVLIRRILICHLAVVVMMV